MVAHIFPINRAYWIFLLCIPDIFARNMSIKNRVNLSFCGVEVTYNPCKPFAAVCVKKSFKDGQYQVTIRQTSRFQKQPVLFTSYHVNKPTMVWSPDGQYIVLFSILNETRLQIVDIQGRLLFEDQRFSIIHSIKFGQKEIQVNGSEQILSRWGDFLLEQSTKRYCLDHLVITDLRSKLENIMPCEVVDTIIHNATLTDGSKLPGICFAQAEEILETVTGSFVESMAASIKTTFL